ncbi:hypothetical protein RB2150_07368 [Rhodobacterales bacterium HTCC2150]|nr:hypothetical protein RB2150_07368 [Rhodobacterales bacterium HTCC2150] [Rhodobacteraceae bacterium HTCC2150]
MMTHGTLRYGDATVPYQVNPDPKRTSRIAIHVEPDGTVVVEAPLGQSDDVLRKAVQRRARWIITHVNEAFDRYKHVSTKQYVSGEEVLYLGRRYMLRVEEQANGKPSVKLKGNKLIVATNNADANMVKPIVRAWYRTKARDYFARLIDEKSRLLPWIKKSPPFRQQEMKRQWGSCSPNGSILLNPHLIKAPRPCIEYVVLHELAHLKHHDHSPEFFRLIDNHLPRWRQSKGILDNMVEVLHME